MLFFDILKKTIIFIIISTVVISLFSACNDSDSPSFSTSNQNYNGPGSKWDVTLRQDSTFTITMRPEVSSAVALTVNGIYERLASGFLKLTVTSSQGQNGPSAGDMAWALEVPGYALLLKPMDSSSDQIIPMVAASECPTNDFDANWVLVKKANNADADDENRDFFGTFSYTAATGTATLPSMHALAGNFKALVPNPLGAGTCANGIMEVDDAVMYLTSNGGAIVHTSVSDPNDASFIFGLTQKAITNIANLDGEYAGILFDDNEQSGDKIVPVSMSCTGGNCTGTIVTNITTGAVSAESVTIDLTGTVDALGSGLITGTITDGLSGNLACMADFNVANSGKQIVSCVGQSPGENTKMFNVLFASKDS